MTDAPDEVLRAFAWMDASAIAERVLLVVAVVAAAVVALQWARRRGVGPASPIGDVDRRVEIAAMAAILLAGGLARLMFAGRAHEPRWWFSELTVLATARTFERGDLLATWRELLGEAEVTFPTRSAVMMPVDAAFQWLLGPSIELPTWIGTVWGLAAVVLAWRLGRAAVSPAFGLAFAALVAFSPLQIAWARIGGLSIGAGTHVLAVMWLAHRAGRRRSVLAAAVAGLLAMTSVYHHLSARVAIPLASIAMLWGLRTPDAGRRTGTAVLALAMALGFVVPLVALVSGSPGGRLWPEYAGYVGSRGERGVVDAVRSAVTSIREEGPVTLRVYFARNRTLDVRPRWGLPGLPPKPLIGSGLEVGGLCLLPVAFLGVVGLGWLAVRPRRALPWILFALLGLALPVFSMPTARRLLAFDLAWCALAAHGVLALLGAVQGTRVRRVAVVAAGGLLATWATVAVLLPAHVLPLSAGTHIPFGESGFNDGSTCLGCVAAGRRVRADVAAGGFVILVDGDADRENRASPAGLRLYGRIGALEAGRARRYVELYSLLQNVDADGDAPAMTTIWDADRTDALGHLERVVREESPDNLVWEFPNLTAWEDALAERLEAAGSERRPFAPPSLVNPILNARFASPVRALRLETPRAGIEEALRTLRAFVAPEGPAGCVDLHKQPVRAGDHLAIALLAATSRPRGGPPRWVVGRWHEALVGGTSVRAREPVAMATDPRGMPARPLRVLDRFGFEATLDGSRRPWPGASRPPEVGHACAAFARDTWWVVDPPTGTPSTREASPWPLPTGRWTGIAVAGDALVLASADQRLHVLDLETGAERRSFPARVSPAWPLRLGDCALIAAGDGWIATLDPFTAVASVYDVAGVPLGRVALGTLTTPDRFGVSAARGFGRYLGAGMGARVETFEVVTSACAPERVSND